MKVKGIVIIFTVFILVSFMFALNRINFQAKDNDTGRLKTLSDSEKAIDLNDDGARTELYGSVNKEKKATSVINKSEEKNATLIPAGTETEPKKSVEPASDFMIGSVNNQNRAYRDDYYARLDYELAEYQMEFPNPDPVEDIVEQFDTSIDYALGTDFPSEKRRIIKDWQRAALKRKAFLDESDEVGDEEYLASLSEIFEECLNGIAESLSSDEFFSLFQISKDEVKGVLLRTADPFGLSGDQIIP